MKEWSGRDKRSDFVTLLVLRPKKVLIGKGIRGTGHRTLKGDQLTTTDRVKDEMVRPVWWDWVRKSLSVTVVLDNLRSQVVPRKFTIHSVPSGDGRDEPGGETRGTMMRFPCGRWYVCRRLHSIVKIMFSLDTDETSLRGHKRGPTDFTLDLKRGTRPSGGWVDNLEPTSGRRRGPNSRPV